MAILRVALVTPLTGPLARVGRAGSTALDVWARQAARLPAGWRGVKLEVHDAHPNPAQAMSASTASHPDVVFGPYGSSPAVAAAAATDRLVWNHGGATSQLARPRFPRVVNVPSPASTYFRGSLQAVRGRRPPRLRSRCAPSDSPQDKRRTRRPSCPTRRSCWWWGASRTRSPRRGCCSDAVGGRRRSGPQG